MTITIVPMCEAHVAEMAELEQVCFSMPWSYIMLRDELLNDFAVYYVAEIEGKVAGYAGIHMIFDDGHITNVAVHPDFRRNGIASALIDKLTRVADRSGVRKITLEVRESNEAAISLYTGKGFKPTAIRKNYYNLPNENAILMTRKLTPATYI